MNLKKETLNKIDSLVPRFPDKRSAALPLCHLVQEDLGFLSSKSIEWIADRLGLQPINIMELVSFYPMLKTKKPGKYQVKICRTLSCALAGSYKICKQFEKAFDCSVGSTSNDDLLSLEFVECHADCAEAPVVMIGEKEFKKVDSEEADRLIKEIKSRSIEN